VSGFLPDALARLWWPLEPNAAGVNLPNPAYAPQPNCRFNADKNASHFCRLTWALGFSQVRAFAIRKSSDRIFHLIYIMHSKVKKSSVVMLASILSACASTPPLVQPPHLVQDHKSEQKSEPKIGQSANVEVGENMYEEYSVSTVQNYTVTVLDNAEAKMDFGLVANAVAGAQGPLALTSTSSYKAMCPAQAATQGLLPGSYGFCLVDTQQNGTFDSAMFATRLRYFPLSHPVKYKVESNPVKAEVKSADFKRTVLYQGLSKGSIKISFREFVKDMARPAFTQDVSYDLEADGTALIAFKGMRVKVLKASGSSITYQVAKPFTDSVLN
jgi:hypothetical protein